MVYYANIGNIHSILPNSRCVYRFRLVYKKPPLPCMGRYGRTHLVFVNKHHSHKWVVFFIMRVAFEGQRLVGGDSRIKEVSKWELINTIASGLILLKNVL